MARRKKSDPGVNLVVNLFVALVALAGYGFLAIVKLLGQLYRGLKDLKSQDKNAVRTNPINEQHRPMVNISDEEDIPLVSPGAQSVSDKALPFQASLALSTKGRWVPAGETLEIAGTVIQAGMVYTGTSMGLVPSTRSIVRMPNAEEEPSLLNPRKAVAEQGDYTQVKTGYYATYSNISKEARRAYLNWLAQGRTDPQADPGYPYLFLYGLERRVLVDAGSSDEAAKDLPLIAQELLRLLSIYGPKSASFNMHAAQLLQWVQLVRCSSKLYEQPLPKLIGHNGEIPWYLKVALGQAARDKAPVNAELALAWLRANPLIGQRTPMIRCQAQFDKLFAIRYTQIHGPGFVVAPTRTKIKFNFLAASPMLRGMGMATLNFNGITDVSLSQKPTLILQALAEQVCDELAAFSKHLARNPQDEHTLAGAVYLPVELWKPAQRETLEKLRLEVVQDPIEGTLKNLFKALTLESTSKDLVQNLAHALQAYGIGMEPDVLGGEKTPGVHDLVVLFSHAGLTEQDRLSTAYRFARAVLQTAAFLAKTEGEFTQEEISYLLAQLTADKALSNAHFERLAAHMRWASHSNLKLPTLKYTLAFLSEQEKEYLAALLIQTVQIDGPAQVDEVRKIEKLYKALGLKQEGLFGQLHQAQTQAPRVVKPAKSVAGSAAVASNESQAPTGFVLDPERISALQKDTERVSALLSGIFSEQAEDSTPADSAAKPVVSDLGVSDKPDQSDPTILGLDAAHSALAKLLMTQARWDKASLQQAAQALDLMLDGALEQINEAAFDAHDMPLTEGDDPLDVNPELLEILNA